MSNETSATSATTEESFDAQYLRTWTEPDAAARLAAVEDLWAADGRLVVSPSGVSVQGREAIAAHVGQVYEQVIVGRGMTFGYDQCAAAGDALLLRWSMRSPDGDVAGRGVDVVFRDRAGRAETIYMFMGIA